MIAYAQFVFKTQMPKFGMNTREIVAILRNKKILTAGVIYVISLLIYLGALSFGQLSIVYPIFASVFVFVMLVSRHLLKELMSPVRVLGLILIISGIVLTALTYGM